MVETTTIIETVSIVLQLVAAYFGYVIYKYNRLSKIWLSIVFALILMTVRRITALLIGLGLLPQLSGTLAFFDRTLLPFIISIFLVLALWGMKKNFESFDVVEKKTRDKIREFQRRK